MPRERYVVSKFGSESVTKGHPDIVCDMIAASILDHAIKSSAIFGKRPRVAIEAAAKGDLEKGGYLALLGEVTLPTHVQLDYLQAAREAIRFAGYTDPSLGFYDGLQDTRVKITQQSNDINIGVSREKVGAGDQGIMFGGAIKGEAPELMPMPIMIAHALTARLTDVRESGILQGLRPDGKSQVVVGYDSRGRPISVEKVTLAASHDPTYPLRQLYADLTREVIEPVLDSFHFGLPRNKEDVIVNGTGRFINCGPTADAGVTNRKIIVNTYGGVFPHGGGGLNGKDGTKVDVAGAVFARFVAKTLVANGFADKVQINIGYTIGQPEPDFINIETFGTEKYPLKMIQNIVKRTFDFSVQGIIDQLDLFRPIYTDLAAGQWMGKHGAPWEQTPSI
jgi:S-adenosylmethionine synthetase